jgi:hypothetical protein
MTAQAASLLAVQLNTPEPDFDTVNVVTPASALTD